MVDCQILFGISKYNFTNYRVKTCYGAYFARMETFKVRCALRL